VIGPMMIGMEKPVQIAGDDLDRAGYPDAGSAGGGRVFRVELAGGGLAGAGCVPARRARIRRRSAPARPSRAGPAW
jgi:hypothetical protein